MFPKWVLPSVQYNLSNSCSFSPARKWVRTADTCRYPLMLSRIFLMTKPWRNCNIMGCGAHKQEHTRYNMVLAFVVGLLFNLCLIFKYRPTSVTSTQCQ